MGFSIGDLNPFGEGAIVHDALGAMRRSGSPLLQKRGLSPVGYESPTRGRRKPRTLSEEQMVRDLVGALDVNEEEARAALPSIVESLGGSVDSKGWSEALAPYRQDPLAQLAATAQQTSMDDELQRAVNSEASAWSRANVRQAGPIAYGILGTANTLESDPSLWQNVAPEYQPLMKAQFKLAALQQQQLAQQLLWEAQQAPLRIAQDVAYSNRYAADRFASSGGGGGSGSILEEADALVRGQPGS